MAVGITADSFIVYFERIRDEMRDGKSMRVAVEAGWVRARATCLAADAVSLLAAVVLYIFSIGVVKGFAFALGISTVIDLVVFFLFTKPMVSWLATLQVLLLGAQARSGLSPDHGRRGPERTPTPARTAPRWRERLMSKLSNIGHALYEGRVSIDFVGRKWLWYAISGADRAARRLRAGRQGPEPRHRVQGRRRVPGLDAGRAGDRGQRPEDPRRGRAGGGGPTTSTPPRSPIVNTSGDEQHPGPDRAAEQRPGHRHLRGDPEGRRRRTATRSARTRSARPGVRRSPSGRCSASVVFLVLVVLFIWAYFREWKMSVGAIVALAHDLVITVGVYALSGFEVTPATVTGILTILGFSLYDTVVVFDKVRENTKNLARTRQTYAEAANLAVNQTLVRSINTSIVALLPVGALLYVGVVSPGLRRAEGPGARAVRRHGGRCVLLDLHRHPARRAAQGARARRSGPATRGPCGTADRKTVDPYASVPAFSEDMPLAGRAGRRRRPRARRREPRTTRERPGGDAVAPARYTAGERPASRPVSPSASAKRAQPTRKPRSQRGKP